MDDGSRSPSPFEGREVVIVTSPSIKVESDGSRSPSIKREADGSPSPFEGREVIIITNNILRKLDEVKATDKILRRRVNIIDLFSRDEARVFIQKTSGIMSPPGYGITRRPMFVTMGNMSQDELHRANTSESTKANEILIWHRANYRPLWADNTTYLNKVIAEIRRR